jgi:monofunctional biosynthetic peptidoglycan transglycosylase
MGEMSTTRSIVILVQNYTLYVCVTLVALQLYFFLRIASFAYINPESTSFERSEAFRIAGLKSQLTPSAIQLRLPWLQEWRSNALISVNLKRAVIVSEDDIFASHFGVQWEAIERAWTRNAKAEELAQQAQMRANGNGNGNASKARRNIKLVGGSTITQQLAKNLFLSKERNLLRKGQELLITIELETLLPKSRILELYLNHVEWGAGVFGAEAASRHYFSNTALQLTPNQCARLAVMLPRPKFFERNLGSAYLADRAEVIESRMYAAKLP